MSEKDEMKNNQKVEKNPLKEEPAPHGSGPKEMLEKGGSMFVDGIMLPQRVVMQIAEEVGKVVTQSIGGQKKKKKSSKTKTLENPTFLDTSAIIDGRVYDLVKIGVFYGNLIVLEGVLGELKNIADNRDDVKKERGRRALKMLDELKKVKGAKVIVLDDDKSDIPVDDRLIRMAKKHKGRIITCDFNLSQKAKISNVISIDLYELANILKTTAIPGELFNIKIMQKGKGEGQGVGYLADGTMVVVEQGLDLIGQSVTVEISRVIQTEAGRIFFAKLTTDNNVPVSATAAVLPSGLFL